MNSPIRVMLVDDQAMLRVGLRAIIEADAEITVVAEAADGIAAVHEWEASRPDVVLMDLRMPGIDGVRAIQRIREIAGPERPRIIVLTTFDEDTNVIAALQAGANGFLSKGVGPQELIGGIKDVHAGRGTLTAAAAAALIQHVTHSTESAPDHELANLFATLTPRELDVVQELARGLDYDEVAKRLFISRFTVKAHATNAMTKVGARDRSQLVVLAYRAGLRPGEAPT